MKYLYCGTNKTALASQEQIANTLLVLMKEKPYDEISVSELCRCAGISRQTFYSLYQSKENVVIRILQNYYCCYTPAEHLPKNEHIAGGQSQSPCRMEVFCRDYCQYLTDHADFICLLVENNITHLLYDSIYESMNECGCFPGKLKAGQRSYWAGFIASGFVGIAKVYVERNCADGAEELANTLISLFSGSLL